MKERFNQETIISKTSSALPATPKAASSSNGRERRQQRKMGVPDHHKLYKKEKK